MIDRTGLNRLQLKYLSGGNLVWEDGVVFPENDPDARYAFADRDACRAWIMAYWGMRQDERCLRAMESVGLVRRIGRGVCGE